MIKSPAQKANVKGQLIEFLRIFFRNIRSFLARCERVSDKAATIMTLTTKNFCLDKRILVVLTRYVIYAENAAGKALLAPSKTSKANLT